MQDHLDFQVVFSHSIDMVLDITKRPSLFLGIIVVDVINDFLFAIAIVCIGIAGL